MDYKMDWILTVSGSDTDGSTVTIYHGVSIEDMKQIIVDKIAANRESSFDFGTETVDDDGEQKQFAYRREHAPVYHAHRRQ